MEQLPLHFEPARRIFTVAELNAAVRGVLETEFTDIWVMGEISGVRQATSGHFYFTLKEQDAQLRCICFRSAARYLRFKPQDGIAALARGHLDVYEVRGEYQLIVEYLEPQGAGALQFAFDQLKKKLAAEGLFDAARKRPLPRFPQRIGIVSSPRGAVIRDMLQILERRFPGLHLRLYPALVQGEGSVEEVVAGIEYFSRARWADVVIVARGGGSLEDLWTFNEEAVARAIASCSVPVISAVGHETDFTIADFVADLRAPTPSAAAELVICTKQEVLDQLEAARQKLQQAVRYRLAQLARALHQRGIDRAATLFHRGVGRSFQRVDELDYRLRERVRAILRSEHRRLDGVRGALRSLDLRFQFAQVRRRLDAVETRAAEILRLRLARSRGRLAALNSQLSSLSPLRILDRGYAIVEDEGRHIVKDASVVGPEALLRVRLARGRLRARVIESLPEGGASGGERS